jgi:hypothetical protein
MGAWLLSCSKVGPPNHIQTRQPTCIHWQEGEVPAYDVRVIIVSMPDSTCQVYVLAPNESVRSWTREYRSKHEGLTELGCVDLLTPIEVDGAQATDWLKRTPCW